MRPRLSRVVTFLHWPSLFTSSSVAHVQSVTVAQSISYTLRFPFGVCCLGVLIMLRGSRCVLNAVLVLCLKLNVKKSRRWAENLETI